MEASSGLLVAMMFVMILSLGIVGLLSSVAGSAVKGKLSLGSRMRSNWTWILLIQLLSMFWSTMTLLEVPDWSFVSFLFILVGPILLFFAASILIATEEVEIKAEASGAPDLSYRFFYMLAGVEAWMVAVDLTMGTGFTISSAGNVAFGLVVLAMAMKPVTKLWLAGTVLAWLLTLAHLILEGIGSQG